MTQALDRVFALEAVRVTEAAAIAAAAQIGRGDKHTADLRRRGGHAPGLFDPAIDGTVVIGEGEMDEAPMLYIGEKVGHGGVAVDIAVDPLEGTNLTAKALPNALAVMAMAEPGTLLNAPDMYMDKIAIGGGYPEGTIDLDADPAENILRWRAPRACSRARSQPASSTARAMPTIIEKVRAAGAAVRLISDGDVAGVIATTDPATGIDIYLGIGRRAGGRAGGGGPALRRRADADPPRFPDRRRARPAPSAWASPTSSRKYS